MRHKIDYLALERKEQPAGSYYAMVKELVAGLRHVREEIPASEIEKHMPPLRDKETKLQKIDSMIGEPKRNYIEEIWEVLENEPEPDDSKSYLVCKLAFSDRNEAALTSTDESFPERIHAEEWIKEYADRADRYVILEVIDPSYLPNG